MKIRSGFVSNSSSSSFVLVGKKIDNDDRHDEIVEELEKKGLESISTENDIYVGKILHYWSDDDYSDEEISIAELQKIVKEVEERLEKCGEDSEGVKIVMSRRYG